MVGRVLEQGWSVYRWLGRCRREGEGGLLDRSSCPHRSPWQRPAAKVELIRSLRKLRMTAAEIAGALELAHPLTRRPRQPAHQHPNPEATSEDRRVSGHT
jgi:hypothetical protein